MNTQQQHHTPHFSEASRNYSPPLHSVSTVTNNTTGTNHTLRSAGTRPESSLLGDLSKSALGDVSRRLTEKSDEIKSLVTNERRLQLALQTLERDFNHNRQVLEEVENDRVVQQERIADRDNVIGTLKERLEKVELLHEEDRARMEKLEKESEGGIKGLSVEVEQLRQRNLNLIEERNVSRLQAVEAQQSSEALRKECELQLAQVRAQLESHREDIRIGVVREYEDKTSSLKYKVDQSAEDVKDSKHRAMDVKNELQRALSENARMARAEHLLKGQLMEREKDVERLETEAKELNRRQHVEIEEWRKKLEHADNQLATLKKNGTQRTTEIHVDYEKKCAENKVLENQIDALRQEHERNLKRLRVHSQAGVDGIEFKVEALEEKCRHAVRERDQHKDAEDRARRQLEDCRQEADRHAAERDARTDEVQETKRKLVTKERENNKLQQEVSYLQKLTGEKDAEVEGMSAAMFLRERRDQREVSTLAAARADELKRAGRLRCGHHDNTALMMTTFGPSAIHPGHTQMISSPVHDGQQGGGSSYNSNTISSNNHNQQQHNGYSNQNVSFARGPGPYPYPGYSQGNERRVRDGDSDEEEEEITRARHASRANSRGQRRGDDRSRSQQKSRSTSRRKVTTGLNVSDPENQSASEADNTSAPTQDTANLTIIRLYEQLLATEREKSQLSESKAATATATQQVQAQQVTNESVRLRSERLAALDALTQVQSELNAAHEVAAHAEREKLDAEARAERLERERLRVVTSQTVASTILPDTSYTASHAAPGPQKPFVPQFNTAMPNNNTSANINTSNTNTRASVINKQNTTTTQHHNNNSSSDGTNNRSSHIPYTSPGRRLEEMKERILAMSSASASVGDTKTKGGTSTYIDELAESY